MYNKTTEKPTRGINLAKNKGDNDSWLFGLRSRRFQKHAKRTKMWASEKNKKQGRGGATPTPPLLPIFCSPQVRSFARSIARSTLQNGKETTELLLRNTPRLCSRNVMLRLWAVSGLIRFSVRVQQSTFSKRDQLYERKTNSPCYDSSLGFSLPSPLTTFCPGSRLIYVYINYGELVSD